MLKSMLIKFDVRCFELDISKDVEEFQRQIFQKSDDKSVEKFDVRCFELNVQKTLMKQ